MTETQQDSSDQVGDSFPELDEAARKRAADRMRSGTDAQAAFAAESVQTQIVRVYN